MSKQIELDKIRLDGGTQMRAEIDYDTVEDYAHAYASGVDMPELTVYCDGSTNWLGDGFHRWHAAKKAGKKTVPCHVKQGSQREAVLFAVGVNDKHGLRRTREDKMIAVRTLLNDPEWSGKSDRWIAEHAKVSPTFVGEQRKQLPHLATVHVDSAKMGKDGRMQTAKRFNRKPSVPAHVPPIDADEPPKKNPRAAALIDSGAVEVVDKYAGDRLGARLLGECAAAFRKLTCNVLDKATIVHTLNTLANEAAKDVEEADAA